MIMNLLDRVVPMIPVPCNKLVSITTIQQNEILPLRPLKTIKLFPLCQPQEFRENKKSPVIPLITFS